VEPGQQIFQHFLRNEEYWLQQREEDTTLGAKYFALLSQCKDTILFYSFTKVQIFSKFDVKRKKEGKPAKICK
jgi:hypothetical protein